MNIKKHILPLATVAILALGLLAGCTNAPGGASSGGSASTAPSSAAAQQMVHIGAVQIIEHASLDAAYNGFVDALAEKGYVDGDNLELDFQNAQGDMTNLSTIADRFVSQDKDLILAISTDATQSVAGKTSTIPILGTAVTSYTTAGLVDSDAAPGGNVSGTCDMNPVAAQIDLTLDLVPQAKTIGLIYNSGEDNSVLQADIAKAHIEELGLAWTEVTVTGPGDVQQAMQSLAKRCEAVYIPTDNTLASAMATVHGVAAEAKLPVVCGAASMATDGGLASVGIDYYSLGYKTGLMAVDVLNGADPAAMPIQYADSSDEITINGQVAREIGYTVPDKYKDAVVEPE